jgi:type II secretory pathway predicted ATPase ExeA
LARLSLGLAEGEGLVLLTGPTGIGKTLLCHCLLDRFGSDVGTAFLTNSHFPDRAALLQAILYELSLPHEGKSEQTLRLALTEYLLARFAAGKPTLLVVDEAQHLTVDALEELRLLGNLESCSGKALQMVLVGQTDLLDLLRRPELTALRQRLAIRAELGPLPLQEAADYLLHHVRVAGGRPEDVFGDEALEVLASGTGGVPRLLNQAARQALKFAEESGMGLVDVEVALEALGTLGLEMEETAEAIGVGVVADSGPVISLPEEESQDAEALLPLTEEEATAMEEGPHDEGLTFPRPA